MILSNLVVQASKLLHDVPLPTAGQDVGRDVAHVTVPEIHPSCMHQMQSPEPLARGSARRCFYYEAIVNGRSSMGHQVPSDAIGMSITLPRNFNCRDITLLHLTPL